MNKIVFTVTNDLCYDQRMHRICNSLVNVGYNVLLVGRKLRNSPKLLKENYQQKRLRCFFNKSFLMYAEYHIKLFFFLLFVKTDAVCSIDLDTILPCCFVCTMRSKKRIYDAHELFTEMKEVIRRPAIKSFWMKVEKFAVPKFKYGYTVSESIAAEFKQRYNVIYQVIRNVPLRNEDSGEANLNIAMQNEKIAQSSKIILYQGAVNEARGLENLVVAMKKISAQLHIYGDGNLLNEINALIQKNNLENKIILKGKALPSELKLITKNAYIGINLVEPIGLNQKYSLANKFFDYIQAYLPQVTMNFPEYKRINDKFEVAVLVDTVDANEVAAAINLLLNNTEIYNKLRQNCTAAKEVFTWQQEEKKLISFYKNFFAD